jgi:ribosome maturation factor RimP
MDAETLVRAVVEGAGIELVDVSMGHESGRRILRVVVDRDGGLDLDAISELSEKVSRRLDLEGFAPGPYELEVSTPGIERPLKRPRDYERSLGARIKVKSIRPIEGSKTHTGALVSADADGVVIATAGEELRVPYADIASARTVVDWDEELKRSTG